MNKKMLMEARTPQEYFDVLDKDFNFTLDPVGTISSPRNIYQFATATVGLEEPWEGSRVFCWPADGDVASWARKCAIEGKKPNTTVVLLAPAKTDADYFHEYINCKSEVIFLKGRLKLQSRPGTGSLLAIYRGPLPEGNAIKYIAANMLVGRQMTAAELTDLLQRSGYSARINGISSRLSELKREGQVIGVGRRTCKVSGRLATVWIRSRVVGC